MFDSHLHTRFSSDSKMMLEEAIMRARELKLGIITTEHMDLMYPVEDKFIFDVDEYFSTYSNYRGEDILIGIEMGMRNDCVEENKILQNNYKFDYVIGSVHLVDGIDIYEDIFYEGKTKQEAYERYFSYMLGCVRSYDFIDSLGHIDYIARYARTADKEIYYKDYAELIDEILRELAKNQKALELNTRRLNNSNTIEKLVEIYRRFRELGGKYVTIGSDSHNINDIGKSFGTAKDMAEFCGLEIVYFKDRIPYSAQ